MQLQNRHLPDNTPIRSLGIELSLLQARDIFLLHKMIDGNSKYGEWLFNWKNFDPYDVSVVNNSSIFLCPEDSIAINKSEFFKKNNMTKHEKAGLKHQKLFVFDHDNGHRYVCAGLNGKTIPLIDFNTNDEVMEEFIELCSWEIGDLERKIRLYRNDGRPKFSKKVPYWEVCRDAILAWKDVIKLAYCFRDFVLSIQTNGIDYDEVRESLQIDFVPAEWASDPKRVEKIRVIGGDFFCGAEQVCQSTNDVAEVMKMRDAVFHQYKMARTMYRLTGIVHFKEISLKKWDRFCIDNCLVEFLSTGDGEVEVARQRELVEAYLAKKGVRTKKDEARARHALSDKTAKWAKVNDGSVDNLDAIEAIGKFTLSFGDLVGSLSHGGKTTFKSVMDSKVHDSLIGEEIYSQHGLQPLFSANLEAFMPLDRPTNNGRFYWEIKEDAWDTYCQRLNERTGLTIESKTGRRGTTRMSSATISGFKHGIQEHSVGEQFTVHFDDAGHVSEWWSKPAEKGTVIPNTGVFANVVQRLEFLCYGVQNQLNKLNAFVERMRRISGEVYAEPFSEIPSVSSDFSSGKQRKYAELFNTNERSEERNKADYAAIVEDSLEKLEQSRDESGWESIDTFGGTFRRKNVDGEWRWEHFNPIIDKWSKCEDPFSKQEEPVREPEQFVGNLIMEMFVD